MVGASILVDGQKSMVDQIHDTLPALRNCSGLPAHMTCDDLAFSGLLVESSLAGHDDVIGLSRWSITRRSSTRAAPSTNSAP
jgi:hypothetical protein